MLYYNAERDPLFCERMKKSEAFHAKNRKIEINPILIRIKVAFKYWLQIRALL